MDHGPLVVGKIHSSRKSTASNSRIFGNRHWNSPSAYDSLGENPPWMAAACCAGRLPAKSGKGGGTKRRVVGGVASVGPSWIRMHPHQEIWSLAGQPRSSSEVCVHGFVRRRWALTEKGQRLVPMDPNRAAAAGEPLSPDLDCLVAETGLPIVIPGPAATGAVVSDQTCEIRVLCGQGSVSMPLAPVAHNAFHTCSAVPGPDLPLNESASHGPHPHMGTARPLRPEVHWISERPGEITPRCGENACTAGS